MKKGFPENRSKGLKIRSGVPGVKSGPSDSQLSRTASESDLQRFAEWNATAQIYSREMFVPALITRHADEHPNRVALSGCNKTVTYGELERRAGQIGNFLQSRGVRRNAFVGICMERSPEFAIAALGALKAGAAYVPLDPEYPTERIAWMLNDTQPAVLLSKLPFLERLPKGTWETRDVAGDSLQTASISAGPVTSIGAGDLAYVIYTSGSTGRPKGVKVTHGNLLNLVFWHNVTFEVTCSDRASQLASPGFDAAVWELWPHLTAGASVHFPDDGIRGDAEALRSWMLDNQISIAFAPTLLAEQMIALEWPRETGLRLLLTGADTLRKYPPPNLPFKLVNNYGPTECTVVATSGVVPAEGQSDTVPSIGRPISNVQIYILDEHLRQIPIGATGEIYIGGAGVSQGYLNALELTSEKFIPNPFQPQSGERLYKTGDLGCYLQDGQIAFRGRIDEQIKIRGYRIEPNEIIAALRGHPMVDAAAVVARDSAGDKQLVAYVVPSRGSGPTHTGLRDFLGDQLPEYMIPAVFVRIDSIPVNASGKVDRTLLPMPDGSNVIEDDNYVAPRTPVEQRMERIVAPLLGAERISVEDNFFMLGGHSLLGTQVIARTRQVFGVELSLRSLFESPSIAALAKKVEQLLCARLEAMSEEEAAEFLRTGQ